jgi:hypothetical protein
MARAGAVNLGQLTRERHPGETILVRFSTHSTALLNGSRRSTLRSIGPTWSGWSVIRGPSAAR